MIAGYQKIATCGPTKAPLNAPYMASIQKIENGYRVQIKKLGKRDSQIFPTRREAVEWASRREAEIVAGKKTPPGQQVTLRQVLRRYADEVAPLKRGERWELVRLAAFESYKLPHDAPIASITPQDIGLFRDARLKVIGNASILRELALLGAVFESARLEWGLIDKNPCRDIRRPAEAAHRSRTLHWREIKAMLRAMGYRRGARVSTMGAAVAVCMLVALRTGMRAGELCALTWPNVHPRHCHLVMTKNGKSRDVPLTRKAKRYIESMRGWDDALVFGLKTASLDALFRKYRERAELSGFTWHDTRHTAATVMSKRVDVLTLCKIFGWSETRQALTYYNPSVSSLADMLE